MPTVQVLKLRELGTDTIIPIRRSAQLGRSPDLTWAADRPIPIHHGLLELAVQIDGTADRVSRNHCAIYRHSNGEFFAVDLRSRNGTTLNHAQLEPGKMYPLRAGNRLLLGNAVGFEVASIENIIINTYALLVGHSGGNLEGPANDIATIASELEKRGFENGNIQTLFDTEATPRRVVDTVKHIASQATEESHTVFYYSGHGAPVIARMFGGLALGDWFSGNFRQLSPRRLYGELEHVAGKKAVIIDSCFSGAFIKGAPPDTLVVTAVPWYRIAREGHAKRFGYQMMGVLTQHLMQYLRDHPNEFNLADLDIAFKGGVPVGRHRSTLQYPQVGGAMRFTIVAPASPREGNGYRRR